MEVSSGCRTERFTNCRIGLRGARISGGDVHTLFRPETEQAYSSRKERLPILEKKRAWRTQIKTNTEAQRTQRATERRLKYGWKKQKQKHKA